MFGYVYAFRNNADTTLPSSRETHGSTRSSLTTNVAHMTLIQDHAEGGKRITDVESFARALKIRQLRHMAEPRPPPHTNFLLYWLDKYYGHLRQGKRLLTSTCDFLHFDPTPQDSCTPHVLYPLGETEWEVKDREAHPKASLGRWSLDRRARADVMFETEEYKSLVESMPAR